MGYAYDALGRLTSLSYLGARDTVAAVGPDDYGYTPSGALAAMFDGQRDAAALFSPSSAAGGLAGSVSYSPYGRRRARGIWGSRVITPIR